MKHIFLASNFLLSILLLSVILAACSGKQTKTEQDQTTQITKTDTLVTKTKKVILFFGNSITAAYGISPDEGFTSLIQKRIDSLGLNYEVINAGLTGETTAGGNTRIDWLLKQKVDILVIELGGNDGLRGINPDESLKNLQAIIEKAKQKYPDIQIVLAGMESPPNMGKEYVSKFRKMYPELATKNQAVLIPFILEGVAGEPKLNLPDGIHPTVEGQKIVMKTVWKYLEKLLI